MPFIYLYVWPVCVRGREPAGRRVEGGAWASAASCGAVLFTLLFLTQSFSAMDDLAMSSHTMTSSES